MAGQCSGLGNPFGCFSSDSMQSTARGATGGAGNLGTWKSGNLTSPLAALARQLFRFPVFSPRRRAGRDRREARFPAPLELGPPAPGVDARAARGGRAWRPPWAPGARPLRGEGSEFAGRFREGSRRHVQQVYFAVLTGASQTIYFGTVTSNLIAASCSGAMPSFRRNGSQRGSECRFSNIG